MSSSSYTICWNPPILVNLGILVKLRGRLMQGKPLTTTNPVSSFLCPDRCNHSFCLACIRSWRNEPLTSRDTYSHSKEKKKACPLCRGESSYLVPSAKHLIGEEKQKFFDQYLSQKANRDCRFFIRSIRGKSRKPQEGKEKEKEKEEGKDANGEEKNKRAKLQPWCPFFDDCRESLVPSGKVSVSL